MSEVSFGQGTPPRESSLYPLIGVSIGVHVLAFIVLPLMTKLFHRPITYARPQTFQLVQPPRPQAPSPPAPKTPPKPKPVAKAKEPAPAKTKAPAPAREEPKPDPQPQEDLSELQDLFEAQPAPARVASVSSDFKYHWYLNAVQQKAERHWKPPAGRKGVKVVVSFTIFRDGSISEVKVAESSGSSVLDNLAVRAIRLAAPFGKLPPGFSGGSIGLNCTFQPVGR